MAQFLTIKILFMTFFSVQYVSPTFKASSCVIQHLLWQSALTTYLPFHSPHCPKLILQYLILMLVFFIIISKKGNIFLKTMKIELSRLANNQLVSYFGIHLSLKQCATLVVKRVCLPQIRAAAKLKWVYLCCCGWIYSLTSFEVIVHIGKGWGIHSMY